MAWIKLSIHPEHDKVLTLADFTGAEPDKVFSAVIRWFFWVDSHAESADISISRTAFRTVTRWPDDRLAEFMLRPEIDWLQTTPEGRLSPTRFDTHMGNSAKVRAAKAQYMADYRRKQNVTTKSPPRPEPDQPDQKSGMDKPKPEPRQGISMQGSSGLAGVVFQLSPDQPQGLDEDGNRAVEVYNLLSSLGVNEPAVSILADCPRITRHIVAQVAAKVRTDAGAPGGDIHNVPGVIASRLARRFDIKLPKANAEARHIKASVFGETVLNLAKIREARR